MSISKTAALQLAQECVGKPIGHGSSWEFYAPYYSNKPHGPSTELHADSYAKAVQMRSAKVADIALSLMGVDDQSVVDYVVYRDGPMPAAKIVSAAVDYLRASAQ